MVFICMVKWLLIVFPPTIATNRRNCLSIKTTVHFLETILYNQWQKEIIWFLFTVKCVHTKISEEFLIGLVTERRKQLIILRSSTGVIIVYLPLLLLLLIPNLNTWCYLSFLNEKNKILILRWNINNINYSLIEVMIITLRYLARYEWFKQILCCIVFLKKKF